MLTIPVHRSPSTILTPCRGVQVHTRSNFGPTQRAYGRPADPGHFQLQRSSLGSDTTQPANTGTSHSAHSMLTPIPTTYLFLNILGRLRVVAEASPTPVGTCQASQFAFGRIGTVVRQDSNTPFSRQIPVRWYFYVSRTGVCHSYAHAVHVFCLVRFSSR